VENEAQLKVILDDWSDVDHQFMRTVPGRAESADFQAEFA
jgi:hypothetical protein